MGALPAIRLELLFGGAPARGISALEAVEEDQGTGARGGAAPDVYVEDGQKLHDARSSPSPPNRLLTEATHAGKGPAQPVGRIRQSELIGMAVRLAPKGITVSPL